MDEYIIYPNLKYVNGVIYLDHGDLAFKNGKIYGRHDHTINHHDMHDAEFCLDINKVKKIIVNKSPYIIKNFNNQYFLGTEKCIDVSSLDSNIYHITCTNLKCKISNYFHLLKENNIYVEIGVKFGGAAGGILEYSKENDLNLSINLFEKDPNCCGFLRQRFNDDKNVTIFEGDASEEINKLNQKYDFVFFDAHHHYKDDYPILQSLIPHLKEETILIFDDYNEIEDVQKLVKEFKTQYPEFKNIYTI